jgi:hypothetical protein
LSTPGTLLHSARAFFANPGRSWKFVLLTYNLEAKQ